MLNTGHGRCGQYPYLDAALPPGVLWICIPVNLLVPAWSHEEKEMPVLARIIDDSLTAYHFPTTGR